MFSFLSANDYLTRQGPNRFMQNGEGEV